MQRALRVRVGNVGNRPEDHIPPDHRRKDLPDCVVFVGLQPYEPIASPAPKRRQPLLVDDIAPVDRKLVVLDHDWFRQEVFGSLQAQVTPISPLPNFSTRETRSSTASGEINKCWPTWYVWSPLLAT